MLLITNCTWLWGAALEKAFAQVKGALILVCEKNFQCHLLGKRFYIKTDHKPIVPLLSSKCLDSLAPRVLRFKLCLARLDYSIEHVLRKNLCTADTLSRAPMATQADPTQDTMGWRDVDNKPELQCGGTEYPTRYMYRSVLIV